MTRQEKIRRRKAARRRKIIALIMGLCIIVLLAVAVFLVIKNRSQDAEKKNVQETQSENNDNTHLEDASNDSAEDTANQAEAAEPEPAMLELTETQKYTGDLLLVNDQYPYHFEENADSLQLVNIKEAQTVSYAVNKEDMQLALRIMAPLDQMIAACNSALNVTTTGISSAYRSIEYQQSVYDQYVADYGQEYADAYVATPGYSEHHTGLAMDLGIYYEDGSEGSFSESENAVWMEENAYHYGFVRRYKESKVAITGINNEAWHFRYVGIPHATYMNNNDLCLEEYLDLLKTTTTQETPLQIDCETGSYQVFYTNAVSIPQPEGTYEISGNNSDGYIITVSVG
jgi:D-alanyl-D-alanine carboxypeptidase